MRSLTDDRAESPMEVMFIVMLAIMLMTIVTFVFGNFIDEFMFVWEDEFLAANPLQSSWANAMYTNIVTNNVSLLWKVPGFFIIVFILWAIKTMVKKHEYTTTGQEIMSDEF